jgi:hypothetical protein
MSHPQDNPIAQDQRVLREQDEKQLISEGRRQQREKSLGVLRGVADQLRLRKEKLRDSLLQLTAESQTRREKATTTQKSALSSLSSIIERRLWPLREETLQYNLITQHCTFYRDAGDARASEIKHQTRELRYNHQMLTVRVIEVRARVAALRQFIREKRPDLRLPEDGARPTTRREEKEMLEEE